MEPRAIVVEHDKAGGRYTVTVGSQGVHGMRDTMCGVLKIDPNTMHVLTPDVGGGFGTKSFNYREYPLVVKAVKTLGRPVKWVSDRAEHFLADAHGRDHVTTGKLALDANGRILALRVDISGQHGVLLQSVRRDHPVVRHGHDDRRLRHPDRTCGVQGCLHAHRTD